MEGGWASIELLPYKVMQVPTTTSFQLHYSWFKAKIKTSKSVVFWTRLATRCLFNETAAVTTSATCGSSAKLSSHETCHVSS
jgi:hypothetical protein